MIDHTTLLAAKIGDLIDSVNKKSLVFTHFLGESELPIVMPLIAKSGYNFRSYGGYDSAQRAIVGISDFDAPQPDWFPISVLCFKLLKDDSFGHRDVLGAVMSLGIKRELIGDIIFTEGYCYIFVEDTISEYIISNLDSVSNRAVSLSMYDGTVHYEMKYEELLCSVMSMRLDCIVSAAAAHSRTDAENVILSGSVRVNGIENKKKDAQLKSGDILTIKRYGKYKIDSAVGTTKKGRIKLRLLKYI